MGHAPSARDAARWAAVLDAALDAIVTIGAEGRIDTFNRAAEQIFGYRAEEAIGQNVRMLMPEPDRSRHDAYVSRYVETGDAKIIGVGREVLAQRKDGEIFPIHLSVGEFTVEGERGFVALIRDISARKQAEAEAREHRGRLAHLDRVSIVGEMATGIAHEVNQPLSAIANYSRALRHILVSGTGDKADLVDTADKIHAQAQRAGDVIRRIREFVARNQARPTSVDVVAAARETITLAEVDSKRHRIPIESRIEDNLPPVRVDRVQLQQVLLNLLRNAIDATAEAERTTPVVVHARRAGRETVAIEVEDRGVGIQPGLEDSLFTTFVTTKASGMGMGLAISRSICEAHGGRLVFRPNAVSGVTFRVELPVASEDD